MAHTHPPTATLAYCRMIIKTPPLGFSLQTILQGIAKGDGAEAGFIPAVAREFEGVALINIRKDDNLCFG